MKQVRLIDRIRAEGAEPLPGAADAAKVKEQRRRLLGSAVPVEISNVAEYVFGRDPEALRAHPKQFDFEKDFPYLAPPWECAFFEWEEPFRFSSHAAEYFPQVGVLSAGIDSWGAGIEYNAAFRAAIHKRWDRMKECRWVRWQELYGFSRARGPVGPLLYWLLGIDSSGALVGVEAGAPVAREFAGPDMWGAFESFQQLLVPVLMATCFMNCKNVALREVKPAEKLSRAFGKRYHTAGLVSYRTIEIEPMKRTLRSEGRAHEHGIAKALHICRGHFKTYTPERPLLGKVAGTFWFPQHLRGDVEEGLVIQSAHMRAVKGEKERADSAAKHG